MRNQAIALITKIDEQGRLHARVLETLDSRGLETSPLDPPGKTYRPHLLSEEEFALFPTAGRFDLTSRAAPLFPQDTDTSLPDLAAGDVIHASYGTGHPGDTGEPELLVNSDARKIAHIKAPLDSEDIDLLVAAAAKGALGYEGWVSLCASHNIHHGHDAEVARRQKNEAFFLATKGNRGRMDAYVLHHTGTFFFWEEWSGDVSTSLENMADEEGLWLLTNGKAHYATCPETGYIDHSEVDGRVARVSLDHGCQHFGIDREEMLDTLRDFYRDHFEHDEEVEAYIQRNFIAAEANQRLDGIERPGCGLALR